MFSKRLKENIYVYRDKNITDILSTIEHSNLLYYLTSISVKLFSVPQHFIEYENWNLYLFTEIKSDNYVIPEEQKWY